MANKSQKKCEIKNCRSRATRQMDHFSLTGEYNSKIKPHHFCKAHFDYILFRKEMRRQMHEFASEDEQISGDYED